MYNKTIDIIQKIIGKVSADIVFWVGVGVAAAALILGIVRICNRQKRGLAAVIRGVTKVMAALYFVFAYFVLSTAYLLTLSNLMEYLGFPVAVVLFTALMYIIFMGHSYCNCGCGAEKAERAPKEKKEKKEKAEKAEKEPKPAKEPKEKKEKEETEEEEIAAWSTEEVEEDEADKKKAKEEKAEKAEKSDKQSRKEEKQKEKEARKAEREKQREEEEQAAEEERAAREKEREERRKEREQQRAEQAEKLEKIEDKVEEMEEKIEEMESKEEEPMFVVSKVMDDRKPESTVTVSDEERISNISRLAEQIERKRQANIDITDGKKENKFISSFGSGSTATTSDEPKVVARRITETVSVKPLSSTPNTGFTAKKITETTTTERTYTGTGISASRTVTATGRPTITTGGSAVSGRTTITSGSSGTARPTITAGRTASAASTHASTDSKKRADDILAALEKLRSSMKK